MSNIYEGTVKFFNDKKGYGFIVPDDPAANSGSDIFVHVRDLEASNLSILDDGQRVSFGIGEYNGKIKASNIKIIE